MTAVPTQPDVAGHLSPTAAPAPPRLGYRPALDGVRALAVALVIAVHVTYLLVPEWSGRWVPGGFLGVDVFFVLSGFLITTVLLEEHERSGTVSLRSFYLRRVLRLLPAVAWLLLVHAVLAVATGADLGVEGRTALAVAVYGLNWVIAGGADVAAGLGHLWSLSIEEQFYLVWPVLLLVALRRPRPTRLLVGIGLIGLVWAAVVRAWLWHHGARWEPIYVRTDARVDELLIGVLLAVAFARGWRLPYRRRHLGTAGLVVLLGCSVTVHRESAWLFTRGGFLVVGLASALLIASVLDERTPLARALAWKPAVAVGQASYSLYLWHVPVFLAVEPRLSGQPAALRVLVGLVACAGAGAVSYRFVELPATRWRARLAGGRT